MKICHLTSAHPRYDTRIFHKECKSLNNNGYNVYLIVADNLGNEIKDGINIFDVGRDKLGRIIRFTKTTFKIFKKAIQIDAEIYHFHDPELIFFAYMLKLKGKKVIYDVHEDLPRQLLSKPYLGTITSRFFSFIIEIIENYFASKFTAVITATSFIRDRFLKINFKSIDVNNFPLLHEFEDFSSLKKQNEVCYVGSLSEVRGIYELVESFNYLDSVKLNLGGSFNNSNFEQKTKSLKSWSKVNALGFLDRDEIKHVYSKSKIGIVTLHPIVNYVDALPVKLFEYMASGLPVVASNIPLWKKIIEENKCGFCVNPLNPEEIANTIDRMIKNPSQLKELAANGRKAILLKYNWSFEESKLINLYANL